MKYMGSKRKMLENGLGELIIEYAKNANRVVDLFCGGGSVSWFAARYTTRPVIAVDLQKYAVILALSVIGREHPIDISEIGITIINLVKSKIESSKYWNEAQSLDRDHSNIREMVEKARLLCNNYSDVGPIWNAYGGYYFSPVQALKFDYLLQNIPKDEPTRTVCLAALIATASKCAASPGHTAQPFQPTETAGRYISASWKLDPLSIFYKELCELAPLYANKMGDGIVGNAIDFTHQLEPDDLVFIDPPYSDVQYSRFYHVLETVAKGEQIKVSGIGRYPPINERPQSGFSRVSESKQQLIQLLKGIAKSRATTLFTFPAGRSSNGLSGEMIKKIAEEYFYVEDVIVEGKFSTLGGNNNSRASRKKSSELILVMKPKMKIY